MTDEQINEQIKFTEIMKNMDSSLRSGQRKGFASMNPEKQKEIARLGGLKVSQNKLWMATIGSRGGKTTQNRKRQQITNFYQPD